MAIDLASITDVEKIDNLMANARRLGDEGMRTAALRRKIEILGGNPEDPLDMEMMRVIAAREQVIFETQRKKLRAAHLRGKYERDGAQATFEFLASKKTPTEGYDSLIESGMIEYTAEHVVLRYPDRFSDTARKRAAERLTQAGATLPTP